MSKKKETPAENGAVPLEGLLLDTPRRRYPIVDIAVQWAHVLKRRQENMHLKKNEILEKALADVLSKKIDADYIAKEIKAIEKEEEQAKEKDKEEARAKLKLKTEDDEDEAPKKKEREKAESKK
ncbi:MAG: hypothetical protein HYT79_11585 [Elusimicrobia bacterium]|nr:hypothetical protein [Elusimicrobiota bacterium]